MNNKNIIAIVIAGLVACCACFGVIGAAGGIMYFAAQDVSTASAPKFTQAAKLSTSVPTPKVVTTPVPGSSQTLKTLQDTDLPVNDLRTLAMRLKGIPDIPVSMTPKPSGYKVGDEEKFWVSNEDTKAHFQITARLVYKTDNVYFFVHRDLSVRDSDVQKLVDTFQTKIYSTNRKFFGDEPNPGVDGDPHLFILYTRGLGQNVGGYASSADGYSRLAQPYSNEKEIFYINAEAYGSPANPDLPGTLAHEFQHMIQGHHDSNEDTWMNEGFSMLAEFLNGYRTGAEFSFVANPDLQLNAWDDSGAGANSGHYGASFMYLAYFLDRFGEDATKALVTKKENGLLAVEKTLKDLKITDKTTGLPTTAVDVFSDWIIANYIGDKAVGDGRYYYNNYPKAPRVTNHAATVTTCPLSVRSATVHQFGADYIRISCRGTFTLNFTGSQQVSVMPATPHSGKFAFWSNRGDKSDTTLTREFDLTNVKSATLKYWALWTIEEDYDYAYVEVSTDGGKTWKIIKTPSMRDTNPTGNNFGSGYTDNSGGSKTPVWVEEKIDLTPYVGKKIQVRFEYITDDAATRSGLLIDDITVPELNYSCDFESDDCGWKAEGFVRFDNILPQTYVVQVIRKTGTKTTVERMTLDDSNTGSIKLDVVSSSDSVIVVVSGTTPFTTELASYKYEIK